MELPDAFIDLMYGAAALADDELNELEQRLHDEITEALAGKLSTEQIPHLPTTAYALLSRLHDPEVTADELISLIKGDPALSAEMVRLANSALFRRGDREVTNLKQATLAVGFNGLRSMVLTSLMQPVLNIRPIYFKLFGQQLWDHSSECAMACAAIAKRHDIDTFNAYLLGLIHDVGKIVLFQMLVETLRVMDPDLKPRPYVLVKLILASSRQLSVEVAKAWQLPEIYQEALRAHAEKSTPAQMPPLGRLLFYGNLLGEAHLALRRKRLPEPAVERLLNGFDLNLEMVRALFPDAPPASRSAA
ncbi:hypothetical protein JCM17961_26800 [Endothiovibrio diazotrophicus]